MSTQPKPRKRAVKKAKAVKKTPPAKRAPDVVAKEAPISAEALERQHALEAAVIDAGADIEHVAVFERQVMQQRKEPIAFALSGTDSSGAPFVEVFRCHDELPAGVHTNLLILEGDRNVSVRAEALINTVRAAVIPDHVFRYDKLIFDTDRIVDIFQVAEAGAYLVEKYTGRPALPSTD